MFRRGSLKQHVTLDGVEAPRGRRRARSNVTIGPDKSPQHEGSQAPEYYGVLTIDGLRGEAPAYVTVDAGMISVSHSDIEAALTPAMKHPAMVKAGDLTVLVGPHEVICIVGQKAFRVRKSEDGGLIGEAIVNDQESAATSSTTTTSDVEEL